MDDGIVLTYMKDGVLYPCGISKEQDDILQKIIPQILGKIYVYTDKPLGEAVLHKTGGSDGLED